MQNAMSDGRASLVLEYYLGRTETPVYDDDGNPVLYTTGAMKGKPKYTVKHNRKKEALNLYMVGSAHGAGATAEQEHAPTRREDTL